MGIIGWLLGKDSTGVYVELPNPLYNALETITHMHNSVKSNHDPQVKRDDIMALALSEYLQKNLWTNTIEDVRLVPEVIRREVTHESNLKSLPRFTNRR